MGGAVDAQCEICGYERRSVTVGRGFDPDHFWWPALCRVCREVVAVDVRAAAGVCEQCGSSDVVLYSDASLRGEPGKRRLFPEWTLDAAVAADLNDGSYLCPVCGKPGLRFGDAGLLWD